MNRPNPVFPVILKEWTNPPTSCRNQTLIIEAASMLHVLIFQTIAKPIWDRRALWGFYLAVWALSWFFPAEIVPNQIIVVMLVLTVFVIPHQVADFYLPPWILNPPWKSKLSYWVSAIGLLTAFGLITYGIWIFSFNFTIALFTPLIIWHWGSLDTIHLYPSRGPSWLAGSIGRGTLVLIAPLYFRPLETQELFLNFVGTDSSNILNTLYSLSGYLLVFAVFLEVLAILIHKFVRVQGLPLNVSAHLMESLMLLLSFRFIHPLYSMAFYFLVLHPLRHMYRTPAYIPESRGVLLEGDGIIKNLSFHFQKTNFLSFLAILALCFWFSWKLFVGDTMIEATAACIKIFALVLIPHSLVTLLVDFNPKQLEG